MTSKRERQIRQLKGFIPELEESIEKAKKEKDMARQVDGHNLLD